MKKILALILAAIFAIALFAAAAPSTTTNGMVILSQTTDADGITTTISAGRVESRQDGKPGLRCHPWVKITTASGRVIRDELDTSNPFPVDLSDAQISALNGTFKAAYDAAHP